jgi:hypothetical protein
MARYDGPPYSIPGDGILTNLMMTRGQVLGDLTIKNDGWVRSEEYTAGVSGWSINADGSVEFNNGTFRGALEASTIDIGGNDSTSFHVDADGNMWLGSGSYATGAFKVSSAGALEIGGGVFSVTTAGVVTASNISITGTSTSDIDIGDGTNCFVVGSDGSLTLSDNTHSIIIDPDTYVNGVAAGPWVKLAHGDNEADYPGFLASWNPGQVVLSSGTKAANTSFEYYASLALTAGDDTTTGNITLKIVDSTLITGYIGIDPVTPEYRFGTYFDEKILFTNTYFSFQVSPSGTPIQYFYVNHNSGSPYALFDNNCQVRVPQGSAGTPGLSFEGDPDTGLYLKTTNEIGFSAAGNLYWFLDYNGGTPLFKANGGARVGLADGTVGMPGIHFNSNTDAGLWREGADRFHIVAGGQTMFEFYNGTARNIWSEAIRLDTVSTTSGWNYIFINTTGGRLVRYTSTERAKVDIERGLEPDIVDLWVRQAQPSRWNPANPKEERGPKKSMGWTAEQLHEVGLGPDLVCYDEDGLPDSVNPTAMIVLNHEAIKMLTAEVERLRERVDA